MNREKELEELILKHKSLYYSGNPIINDFEYDKLEEELRTINPGNYALEVVGTDSSSNKVIHAQKMLSLNKVYEASELIKWQEGQELIALFKIDGISCSLIYEDEKLVLSKTRGDGLSGENITNKTLWIDSIPKTIRNFSGEIRGEIYCSEKNFYKLSSEMQRRSMETPSSQRNIVAGLIGRKEEIDLAKYLTFSPFELIDNETYKFESDRLKRLEDFGFETLDYSICNSRKDIDEELEKCLHFMQEGDFLIDGHVFIINELAKHGEMGYTAHHPKFKMAYKFRGESAQATIQNIEWSVSRNGILTPVANIEPVELSGATISRVTLHNFGLVNQFKLKRGDLIEIVRSGEVIPKFLSVKQSSKNEYEYPKNCPSCNSEIEEVEIRLFCRNPDCPAKKLETILNFIQKIGINDLSSKRLEQMISVGIVRDIDDLYKMTKDQLLTLEKTKDKLAEKLLDEINKSKQADLITFLSALGIPGGAYNKCERIVKAGYDSIEKVQALTVNTLCAVEGFAEKSARDFIEGLKQRDELISKLVSIGFDPVGIEIHDNFCFCITGSLNEKRSSIETKIRSKGHKVVSSVTKETTHLVCNVVSNSSKYKKAVSLQIPIITEQELFEIVL